jgi:L-alanine-DL-glutamate epimerase-like enolase superfamily enzyme
VETRGNSAVDIALWDIFGKAHGKPVCDMLGGRSRDKIRVYNTCAGYRYIRDSRAQKVANWGIGDAEGAYEDLEAFLHHADDLAHSLLEQGITGMKIWPFDPYAEASRGTHISAADLDRALEPFRQIRAAVGSAMDVMVEFHSLWTLPAALRIARALEPFAPYWFEDPLKADNLDALATFAAATPVPTVASETLATRWSFREVLERGAARIVMLDLSWCGGLTEAKQVAAMAEAYQLPVAPHDCTGPVALMAGLHLALHAPTAIFQEVVRATLATWYRDLVTELPLIKNGMVQAPSAPGLGLALNPDVKRREDAIVRESRAER